MTEYGIFSDEGCVSAGYETRESAEAARRIDDPDGSSELYVAEVCPDHEGRPRVTCEFCNAEGDDE